LLLAQRDPGGFAKYCVTGELPTRFFRRHVSQSVKLPINNFPRMYLPVKIYA
jgi:hypothetical protein